VAARNPRLGFIADKDDTAKNWTTATIAKTKDTRDVLLKKPIGFGYMPSLSRFRRLQLAQAVTRFSISVTPPLLNG
jgi:hypothetical protein